MIIITNYNLPILAVSSCIIIYTSIELLALNEKNKKTEFQKQEEIRKQVQLLSFKYNQDIRPLANQSIQICNDWTNTNCQTASELIPFIKKYSIIKNSVNNSASKNIKAKDLKDLKDYEVLEDFRKKEMRFWLEQVKNKDIPLSKFIYPGFNELKSFSTFHWALFHCMSSPYTEDTKLYDWIMKQLEDESLYGHFDRKKIDEYRNTLRKEFEKNKKLLEKIDL